MRCGLIGQRLGHSYSCQIHHALADYSYELWELEPEELAGFLEKRDFAGINVTIPYKEQVIPYLDELSETARAIGAVNTVVNRNGRLVGDNTDLPGMLALIRRMRLTLAGKKVLILGTGGTSKTARAAAAQLHAAEIYRVSRCGRGDAITYQQAAAEHGDAACIINTTPCGMYPDVDACPVDLEDFPRLEGVVDAVYNPLRTDLVLNARRRGIAAEGGLYMLAAQAAYAGALFRGCTASQAEIDLAYYTVRRQMENIVLIGMPTSGKTTVGQLLSQRTGKTFMDTDAMVEQAVGMTIPAYFAAEGESAFRQREQEAVAAAAGAGGRVIATGGGVILREENLHALRRSGRLVFLDRSLDKLTAAADRPLSADTAALPVRRAVRPLLRGGGPPCGWGRHTGGDRSADRKGVDDMKILVINGPNLNLLGVREPAIYGSGTYQELLALIRAHAEKNGAEASFFQSNHEGALVDAIQQAYFDGVEGIILNPAAYTHTSVALLDALKAVAIPTVEVHISDVSRREDFRRRSYVRPACVATVMGRGFAGYLDAMDILLKGERRP